MLLLKNGMVLSMERPTFIGDVLLENGVIKALGEQLHESGAQIIDCTAQYIMPGIVDSHCHIGMWEDGIGEEGADGNEQTDPITPDMRAIDGVNPFDPCFREAYEAGITTVVTGPGSANVIGGQFAAMKTYGSCVEDMLIKAPAAMKAALGENPKRVYTEQKEAPYTRMAIASLMRRALVEAEEYKKKLEQDDPDKYPDRDLALESLLPVLDGTLTLKVHAHRADDILTAFRIAEEFKLKLSIEHCTEGHLITDLLKQKMEQSGAMIILGPLLSERPKVEMKNLSYDAPRILHEAGIRFALMSDHPATPIQYLPVYAALCVRQGLPEQVALEAITINAARAVDLDLRVGSILPGKDADIAVFNAHPLDARGRCIYTIINGKLVYQL